MGIQKEVLNPLPEEFLVVSTMQSKSYSEEEIQKYIYDYRDRTLRSYLETLRDSYVLMDADEKERVMDFFPAIVADDYFWDDPSLPWKNMTWEQMTHIPISDKNFRNFIPAPVQDEEDTYWVSRVTDLINNIVSINKDAHYFIQMSLQAFLHITYFFKYDDYDKRKWNRMAETLANRISNFKPNRKTFMHSLLQKFAPLGKRPIELSTPEYGTTYEAYAESISEILQELEDEEQLDEFLNLFLKAVLTLADIVRNKGSFLEVVQTYPYGWHASIVEDKMKEGIYHLT